MKKLEVKYYSIDKIKPYENNPRVNEPAIDAVAESIKEYDFRQPIVVDKDFVIVVGHTRYYAAKKLKLKEVPISIGDDLTEEQVKAYRLADNRVGEFALWDVEKLEQELSDLADIDMSVFGFIDEKDEDISQIEGVSFINDLLNNEFSDVHHIESDFFTMSFLFNKENKEEVDRLIKEKGKEFIVEMIVNEAKKEEGE